MRSKILTESRSILSRLPGRVSAKVCVALPSRQVVCPVRVSGWQRQHGALRDRAERPKAQMQAFNSPRRPLQSGA